MSLLATNQVQIQEDHRVAHIQAQVEVVAEALAYRREVEAEEVEVVAEVAEAAVVEAVVVADK